MSSAFDGRQKDATIAPLKCFGANRALKTPPGSCPGDFSNLLNKPHIIMAETESKPQINRRKYAQIGIASLAAVAIVIGLSVGLSQRNDGNRNFSSSNAYGDYDDSALEECYDDPENESDGGGKSGKSGGSKSGGRRGLNELEKRREKRRELNELVQPAWARYMPGTEDYERLNLGLTGGRGESLVLV